MATRAHEAYLRANAASIVDPVLLIGSRHYTYDAVDLTALLQELGARELIGTDLVPGQGVDQLLDITWDDSDFFRQRAESFGTVVCLEVLTYVRDPFAAARNITRLVRPTGCVFLAECIVRKTSQMPVDRWRFTYEGLKTLFAELEFDDDCARMSFPREKTGRLMPYSKQLPEVMDARHADESSLGYLVRRAHRRLLAKGVFRLSRLMPEVGVHAIGRRR